MNNIMILEEFSNSYEILKEDTDRGARTYKIRGIMGRANYVNKNKRIYPIPVAKESIEEIQPMIESSRFLGEISHPSTPAINMDKVSHKIIAFKLVEDGSMIGEMIPAGPNKDLLISFIEDEIGFGVSTRGTGQVRPYSGPLGEGLVEVAPGYKLRAVDIVHEPSASAFPSVIKEELENFFTVPNNFKAVWDEVFNK